MVGEKDGKRQRWQKRRTWRKDGKSTTVDVSTRWRVAAEDHG